MINELDKSFTAQFCWAASNQRHNGQNKGLSGWCEFQTRGTLQSTEHIQDYGTATIKICILHFTYTWQRQASHRTFVFIRFCTCSLHNILQTIIVSDRW